MKSVFEYIPYAEDAILIRTTDKIMPFICYQLLAYKQVIEEKYAKAIIEVVQSYNSLLVVYKCVIEDFYTIVSALQSLEVSLSVMPTTARRLWEIPVCYEKELVPEIEAFAMLKSMTISEVVALHTAPLYTVYFIGFLPGFMYLGGLDAALATPRKATPNLQVPKGSVAIGGQQTGIYPSPSPAGWHVMGRSPVTFFEVANEPPCFVQSGDQIQLVSINEQQYHAIHQLAAAGVYVPKSTVI